MKRTYCIFALAVAVIVPTGLVPASDLEPAAYRQVEDSGGDALSLSTYKWFDPSQYEFIQCGTVMPRREVVARFGWWGVDVDGSPSNVGEWQGLDSSSPFWDVDGLVSDGRQTFDFYASGPESESTQAGLYYYGGPGMSADVEYDRYIHRLGHDPLDGFNVTDIGDPFPPNYPAPLNGAFWGEDSNVGRDYAIRVQELNADFKGKLTQNIKWRLNVWNLKKEGTRQANALTHCYNAGGSGSRCHLVARPQDIHWVTTQVEPAIEARFGCVTVEYAHTIRSFKEADQILLNDYTGFGFGPLAPATDPRTAQYALVPENITEIDRIKGHAYLGPCTDLYVLGYTGNTHNDFRETDRKFHGLDVRLSHRTPYGLSLTNYWKTTEQENERPTFALNDRYNELLMREDTTTLDDAGDAAGWPHPRDYRFTAAGVKGRWKPFHGSCGLPSRFALNGGYEWREITRAFAEGEVAGVPFVQPDTITNMFFLGLSQRWSPCLDTFIRYTWKDNDYPLVGVNEGASFSVDAGINSNLPQREQLVEIGGTWSPASNFLVNASFWIENTYNHTEFVDFEEDSYPYTISAWWAPDCRWSFSAGYANFTNWIEQDITLGGAAQVVSGGGPHIGEWESSVSFTSPWNYGGQADVVDLGANYAYSCDLRLVGGFQYTRGVNVFSEPTTPTITDHLLNPIAIDPYSDLPGYSRVEVNTYRVTAGFDYRLTANIDCYFRYNFYDFDNQGSGYQAGTAHMALGGVSAIF